MVKLANTLASEASPRKGLGVQVSPAAKTALAGSLERRSIKAVGGISINTKDAICMGEEKQVGTVTHWYDKLGVAVVKLTSKLSKGDTVKVKKGEEEFEDIVSSLQIDHKDVVSAKKGDDAAIKFSERAKEGASVFLEK